MTALLRDADRPVSDDSAHPAECWASALRVGTTALL